MTLALRVALSTAFAMGWMLTIGRYDIALALAIPTVAYGIIHVALITHEQSLKDRAKRLQKRREAIARIKDITGVVLDENATAEEAQEAIRASGYYEWRQQYAVNVLVRQYREAIEKRIDTAHRTARRNFK